MVRNAHIGLPCRWTFVGAFTRPHEHFIIRVASHNPVCDSYELDITSSHLATEKKRHINLSLPSLSLRRAGLRPCLASVAL